MAPRLEHRDLARTGNYVFIPANVPHVAANRSASPAVFMGVRDEASRPCKGLP